MLVFWRGQKEWIHSQSFSKCWSLRRSRPMERASSNNSSVAACKENALCNRRVMFASHSHVEHGTSLRPRSGHCALCNSSRLYAMLCSGRRNFAACSPGASRARRQSSTHMAQSSTEHGSAAVFFHAPDARSSPRGGAACARSRGRIPVPLRSYGFRASACADAPLLQETCFCFVVCGGAAMGQQARPSRPQRNAGLLGSACAGAPLLTNEKYQNIPSFAAGPPFGASESAARTGHQRTNGFRPSTREGAQFLLGATLPLVASRGNVAWGFPRSGSLWPPRSLGFRSSGCAGAPRFLETHTHTPSSLVAGWLPEVMRGASGCGPSAALASAPARAGTVPARNKKRALCLCGGAACGHPRRSSPLL